MTLDTTQKLYIGGKQARPDGGYSFQVEGQEFALANRKDIRNAVEAAAGAQSAWAGQSGHLRAQVLYYLAENLENARDSLSVSPEELSLGIQTLFDFAAMADKFDGQVHGTPFKGVTYTLNEPIGVLGAVLPDQPALLAILTSIGSAIAMGNALIAIPSRVNPLPASQLYRILEASDIPAGVVNILTGEPAELAAVLADHDGVDALWCFREDCCEDVERRSAGNLKQVWTASLPDPTDLKTWLRHATQVKNVWIPMGE